MADSPNNNSYSTEKYKTVAEKQSLDLARTDNKSSMIIGAKEARGKRPVYPRLPAPDEPIVSRRKGIVFTFSTSPEKPPLKIRLNPFTSSLFLVVILAVTGLAVFGALGLIFGNGLQSSGDNLSWQNSSSVREQQRQQVIDLQERKLASLQEENNKRLLELGELEGQLQDLSDSINSMKGIAKQLQDLLGLSSTSGSGQIPPVPATTKAQGGNNSSYIPPIRVAGGYIDPVQGQQYLSQFNGLLTKLDGFSQVISTRRKSLSEYEAELSTLRQDLSQQSAQYNQAAASLSQLINSDDGANPPSVLPWYGQITSVYGWRMSPFVAGTREFHYGVDINAAEGTPVQTTKSGVVTYVGYDSGYGNMVEVTHAGGWLTRYGHNSKIVAKIGQTVKKGDIIALSGNTGASTGPHIHYEIHKNGVPVNPATLVPWLAGQK